MPRVCTACALPEREALDLALVRGEPKRQIAARFGLAESTLGRHARAHLPHALASAELAREAATADALLGESLALQAKALDLLARAEAEGDVRGAIVALREARECVELRARIGRELLASNAEGVATLADLARGARETLKRRLDQVLLRVEYVEPE